MCREMLIKLLSVELRTIQSAVLKLLRIDRYGKADTRIFAICCKRTPLQMLLSPGG
jgi:hypothetical protein